MIINTWRAGTFLDCRQKAKRIHIDCLSPLKTPENLIKGDAVHKGLAAFFVSGDVHLAEQRAESTYRERYADQMILPEEQVLIEQGVQFARAAVQEYALEYPKEQFQVLHPEVEFAVELPDTKHHCWWAHHLCQPSVPFDRCLYADSQQVKYAPTDDCYQSHWFVGRTDAIVSWQGKIWLLEHKTTSLTTDGGTKAQPNFFARFELDFQPTGYCYGVGKQLGINVNGFILNAILKPRKNSKDPFAINFDRDIFVRTKEQLAVYEREMIELANDYERAAIEGRWYKNTHSCMNYNRKCDYLALCKGPREPHPGEYTVRDKDYVDLRYYKLLGLEPPAVQATEFHEGNLGVE